MQSSDSKTNGSVKLAASICDLTKHYVLKSETVRALRGVSFDVPESDYIAIMGPSGSGKSTLLNLLGCLDRPTTGSFFLGDDDVASMSDDQLSFIRASRIGFVFQAYNLIAQLSVVENIEVPLYYTGRLNNESRKRSTDLARMVGLADRLDHRPTQLSGGQQQRVAIARSMVNNPYFILADEATGNLDSVTTAEILALFHRFKTAKPLPLNRFKAINDEFFICRHCILPSADLEAGLEKPCAAPDALRVDGVGDLLWCGECYLVVGDRRGHQS